MQAREIMSVNVATVSASSTVAEAAQLLLARHISGAPVMDEAGRLVGIVSEGDFLRRQEIAGDARPSWWLQLFRTETEQALDYMKAHSKSVKDIMTRHVVTVREDTDIGEIARLMETNRIKRVPVARDGGIVGIVSRADLLRAIATKGPEVGGSAPGDPELRERVLDALHREPWGGASTLNVTVSDAQVAVWGIVNSPEARTALRIVAENVPGVRTVELHIGTLPEWAWAD